MVLTAFKWPRCGVCLSVEERRSGVVLTAFMWPRCGMCLSVEEILKNLGLASNAVNFLTVLKRACPYHWTDMTHSRKIIEL